MQEVLNKSLVDTLELTKKMDYNSFVCRFFVVALFVENIQAAPLNVD
jgi:hypothetical protein